MKPDIVESTEYESLIGYKEEIPKPATLYDFLGEEEPDERKEWEKHWIGMPEYTQEDNPPYKKINVSFRNKEDYLNETTREIQSPGIIIKRSFLVEESAKNANLNFIAAQHNITTHVTMPGFYKSIDCLIASSTALEAGGLPVLEAGAAGRLVISTPVGHWDEKVGFKGGISVPIPEQEFIDKTTEVLIYYKNNQSEYNNRCEQIQEYSRRYDWSNVIEHWVKLILDN